MAPGGARNFGDFRQIAVDTARFFEMAPDGPDIMWPFCLYFYCILYNYMYSMHVLYVTWKFWVIIYIVNQVMFIHTRFVFIPVSYSY